MRATTKTFPGLCAVVVTFQPDDQILARLQVMQAQSDYLIIVDNGSSRAATSMLSEWSEGATDAELIDFGRNVGLAAGLNAGLQRARTLGFSLAVTYDQDSLPADGMVSGMLDVLERYPEPETVAVIGPRIVDRNAPVDHYRWLRPNPKLPLLFERVSCNLGYRDDISFVITSGSLLPLVVFERLGGFREDLFIDYVDHEYCLRARASGYRVLVTGNAELLHALGAKREVKLGSYSVRPTFHASERLYYIYRNRIPLILRYAFKEPHWLAFDLLATTHNLLRVLLFEHDRYRKLRAALGGTIDGLRGRMGPRRRRQGDRE